MMRIYVPTRGRVRKQVSIQNLTPRLRERVTLVCPEREVHQHTFYHKDIEVLAQPDPDWRIFEKRRWILKHAVEQGYKKIVMLDDDLRWCQRRTDDPKKFTTATPAEVQIAFNQLEEHLSKDVPHAGFGARGGSISPRAQQGGWQEAKRMMCVLGYYVPTLLEHSLPFRIETREDMDTSLQLLRKGFPNVVNYSFVCDQKFGAPGGASLERDFGRANADARTLEKYHPGLVRVVEKEDKGRAGLSEEARTRLEVVVQWQRALLEGQQWRESQAGGGKARTGGKGKR